MADVYKRQDGAFLIPDQGVQVLLDGEDLYGTRGGLAGIQHGGGSDDGAARRVGGDPVSYTHLYTGLTGGKLTVAANGTATFTVTIALTASGKAYLDENFPNGSYVEGFTFLTAEDAGGVSLSVPFLGFYGDWRCV